MTTTGRLTTKGFEDYLEKLAAAGRNVDNAVDRALEAAAPIALAGMIRRAPKKTGHLASHLFASPVRFSGNFRFVKIGLDVHDLTALYGIYEEYGSPKSGRVAHPFIRPAMIEARRSMVATLRKSLEEDGIL
jgi:HK97 gp10 family phage protein